MGYQLFPKRNLKGLTILNTASPSLSKKRKINTTKNIEANPQINISFSITSSLIFLIYHLKFNLAKSPEASA
jgi:hypothetical protein